MLDPTRLVFIDETAANTKMVRLSGRCPRGERLVASVKVTLQPFDPVLIAARGCMTADQIWAPSRHFARLFFK